MDKVNLNGEDIYLFKGFFGWKVVKPWKNEDGSINWKNFLIGGSWWNLFLLLAFVVIIIGSILEYTNAVRVANECLASNPLYGILN